MHRLLVREVFTQLAYILITSDSGLSGLIYQRSVVNLSLTLAFYFVNISTNKNAFGSEWYYIQLPSSTINSGNITTSVVDPLALPPAGQ